jgi:gliding motility-associated-like protein
MANLLWIEFDEIDGEYVCLGDDFTYSFDATDRDGDELRYSLVTPLSFFSIDYANTLGVQGGGRKVIPTEFIEWQPGYSATNAIPGNPALRIDPKIGELSVRASQVGLFTFTVLVEEYRNSERIGATRRDYQLFVFDCPPLTPPDATITINDQPATETSACQGADVVLKATANPNWGYQWKKDGDNLPNATGPTLTVTEGGVYQLVTYLKDQCSKTRRSRKVKIDFTTSRYKLKTNGPPKICSNNGRLTIESPENANYSYQWYKDGLALSLNRASIIATAAGNYWAVLRDVVQGCSSRSDTVNVKTVTAATANISSSDGNGSPMRQLCTGTTTTLSAQNDALGSYQWTKNGQTLPNETKPTLTVSTAGDYAVTAKDTNGCAVNPTAVKIEVVNKVTVRLDSLPNFCGINHAAISLVGTPAGGVFAGAGVSNGQFDPKMAGIGTHSISYTVKGALDCQNGEATRRLTITPPPILDLGNDRELFRGSSLTLNGDLGIGYQYVWSPPTYLNNARTARPIASPEATTTYILTATGPNGCVATDTIKIVVMTTIYIPDVFTPNGDSVNDTWVLRGLENYPEVEVRVFNRWGNVVFYGKGPSQLAFDGRFNGTMLPSGVYTYLIDTKTNSNQVVRGSLLLAR